MSGSVSNSANSGNSAGGVAHSQQITVVYTIDRYNSFFDQNYGPAKAVADAYKVDVGSLLGLSALESSWGTSDQALNHNNPFGATPNGKTPVTYESFKDAWRVGQGNGDRELKVSVPMPANSRPALNWTTAASTDQPLAATTEVGTTPLTETGRILSKGRS